MEFIVLFIIIPFAVGAVLFVIFKPQIKGYLGEKTTSLILKTLPSNYIVLDDIMLRTDYGTTQIDHVVISNYGIFVIETKNYKGWIYGNDNSPKWTQVLYKQKYQFMNPLHQNYKHCKAIERLIGDDRINIISIIAFPEKATLKVNIQNHVVYFSLLRKTIQNYNHFTVSNEDCIKIKDIILKNNIADNISKKEHVDSVRSRIHRDSIKVKNNICLKCNSRLVQRKGKYGYFMGCSNYPKCRYIAR